MDFRFLVDLEGAKDEGDWAAASMWGMLRYSMFMSGNDAPAV